MRKKIITALAALALALPYGASADDLTLPGGVSWPLGKEISVHAGSDSYFAKDVEKMLADPKLPKELAKNLVKADVYGKKEKKGAETFAKDFVKILRDVRVYQLSGACGTDLHVATVVSGAVPEDFLKNNRVRWETFAKTWREKFAETECGRNVLPLVAEQFAPLADMELAVRKTDGVTAAGVPYEAGSVYMAPEFHGLTVPVFCYYLRMKTDGEERLAVIFTDQASGSFFEPFLEKGVGELQ